MIIILVFLVFFFFFVLLLFIIFVNVFGGKFILVDISANPEAECFQTRSGSCSDQCSTLRDAGIRRDTGGGAIDEAGIERGIGWFL